MKKVDIYCTLGPSSLNKKFLKFANGKISLMRLNMSHLNYKKLPKIINFIKKNCSIPICIDTEGAQIRTKIKFKREFKKKQKITLNKSKGKFNLYPSNVFDQLRKNDILDIGFEGLRAKIIKKNNKIVELVCLQGGMLANNKGVHVENRKIKMNFITDKDIKAINIAKKFKIKNFALSFTNRASDVIKFSKIIPSSNRIYKIETSNAIKNLNSLFKVGKNFLIDRGDLSKDIGSERVPIAQRHIFLLKKKSKNIKISIATNFLESMTVNPYPTRAEVNDVFNALEMGANGLVLAAETAIGKYPRECVSSLIKIIKSYQKRRNSFKI